MEKAEYNTRLEIDLIQFELNLENDLNILFETGFNHHGRALCWMNSEEHSTMTQCVIDISGKIVFQSNSYLTRYEKGQYLDFEKQLSFVETLALKEKLQCETLSKFSQGVASYSYRINGDFLRYNFVNLKGEILFETVFRAVKPYSDGWFPVQYHTHDRWYIDKDEKKMTASSLSNIKSFKYGLSKDGRGRLINSHNKKLTNESIDFQFSKRIKWAMIHFENRLNFINSEGRWLYNSGISLKQFLSTDQTSKSMSSFDNGIISLYTYDQGIQYLNIEGDILEYPCVDFKYIQDSQIDFDFHKFIQGFAVVKTEKGYNFLDQEGKMLLVKDAKSVTPFSHGLSLVWDWDGSHSFIDRTGTKKIELKNKFIDSVDFLLGRIFIQPEKGNRKRKGIDHRKFVIDLGGKLITISDPYRLCYDFEMDGFSIKCNNVSESRKFKLDWWGNRKLG